MRKSILFTAVFVLAAFAVGYLAGSVNGVMGSLAANGRQTSPTATPSTKCVGARPFGPHAAGVVTAVSGNTITITPATGVRGPASAVTQIVTTSSTKFYAGPGATASLSAVKKGEIVRAVGALSADGKSLTAMRVFVGTGDRFRPHFLGGLISPGPHAAGMVMGVHGDTISVTPLARFGALLSPVTSIVTNSSTTFFGGPGSTASLSGVKSGDVVVAAGTLSSDGKTLTATRVFVVNPNAVRSRFMHGWGRYAPGQFNGARQSASSTL